MESGDARTDLNLDRLSSTMESEGTKANEASATTKGEVLNKVLIGMMALGSLIGIGPAVISIYSYIEAKLKGQKPAPPQGVSQQKLDEGITTFLGLTDEQTWRKLYSMVKGDAQDPPMTYPQQLLLLNFLERARPTGGRWTWTSEQKYNLIIALSKDYNDYDMYRDVWMYTLGGHHVPFSVGAQVVGLALTQKYNPS